MKKTHLGLGVIAVMSLKGTATLTAAFLLPTWPARFIALGVIAAIGVSAFLRYRRRKLLSPQNTQKIKDSTGA